jgi:hypothetical protein
MEVNSWLKRLSDNPSVYEESVSYVEMYRESSHIGNDHVAVSEFRFIGVSVLSRVRNLIRCFSDRWDFSELPGVNDALKVDRGRWKVAQCDVLGTIEKVGLSSLPMEHRRGADDHETAVAQTFGEEIARHRQK